MTSGWRVEHSSALGAGLLALVAVVLISGLSALAFARALPQEPAPPLEVGETGESGESGQAGGTVPPSADPDPTVSQEPDADDDASDEDSEQDEEEAAREAAEDLCEELLDDELSYPDALDVIATEGTYQIAVGAGEHPCEESYDEDEVEDYLDLTPPDELRGGLSCGALRSRGYTYADALEYWVEQGSPYRMEVSDGVPCGSTYPDDIVDAYFDEAG